MFRGASSTDNVSLYAAHRSSLDRRSGRRHRQGDVGGGLDEKTHNEPLLLRRRMRLQSFRVGRCEDTIELPVWTLGTYRHPCVFSDAFSQSNDDVIYGSYNTP